MCKNPCDNCKLDHLCIAYGGTCKKSRFYNSVNAVWIRLTRRVKVYKVYPEDNPDLWYYVDAPSKRIAKWCGANMLNATFSSFLSAEDMVAERFRIQED